MGTFNFDQDLYIRYLDTIPGEQAQGLEQFVQECLHEHRLDKLFERGLPFMTPPAPTAKVANGDTGDCPSATKTSD